MDRASARQLPVAIRLIREPVVVTYSYPRSHPLYGAGEECGVFVPMKIYEQWAGGYVRGYEEFGTQLVTPPPDIPYVSTGAKLPDIEERYE